MTARELILKQIAHAENQVIIAIAGLDAEAAETRTNAQSMTIREHIVHLGECAIAAQTAFSGGSYDAWGSWTPEDRSWAGVKKAWQGNRSTAIASLPQDDEGLEHAYDFLVAHDYYHVGQIAAARRVAHPEWDTYAIYGQAEADAL